jgi:hypothetical protein
MTAGQISDARLTPSKPTAADGLTSARLPQILVVA